MDAPALLISYADLIETELKRCLAPEPGVPAVLCEAMAYSACGGGKRFRGGLAMGACVAVGGRAEQALPAACALEMVHAFSLIHDDLPCMDNSDLRRGRPTCHRVYGEALALLAGDGLLVRGVQILCADKLLAPEATLSVVRILLAALGIGGMVGGQVMDMAAEHTCPSLEELRALDAAKTGALIRASARIGAIAGGGGLLEQDALDAYAASLGLAFQIVDDLLDVTGDAAALGKPAGADSKNGKATYPGLLGLDRARELADREIERAIEQLAPFGERGAFLAELARYVGARDR